MNESKYFTSKEVMKGFVLQISMLRSWLKAKTEFTKPIRIGRRNLWLKSEIGQYESYVELQRGN